MKSLANRLLPLLAILTVPALGAELSYLEAEKIWEESKDRQSYRQYLGEFLQFNNHFRLDERDGCYALGTGAVNLYLIIARTEGAQYAAVESVLSDVDNAKSQCFRKTYTGLSVKAPPYKPFVLQMDFAG